MQNEKILKVSNVSTARGAKSKNNSRNQRASAQQPRQHTLLPAKVPIATAQAVSANVPCPIVQLDTKKSINQSVSRSTKQVHIHLLIQCQQFSKKSTRPIKEQTSDSTAGAFRSQLTNPKIANQTAAILHLEKVQLFSRTNAALLENIVFLPIYSPKNAHFSPNFNAKNRLFSNQMLFVIFCLVLSSIYGIF